MERPGSEQHDGYVPVDEGWTSGILRNHVHATGWRSLVLALKHFNADLTGWEEKNEVRRFRLLKLTPTEAYFEGMTFRRLGPDSVHVQVAIEQRDGTAREEDFRYTRVK